MELQRNKNVFQDHYFTCQSWLLWSPSTRTVDNECILITLHYTLQAENCLTYNKQCIYEYHGDLNATFGCYKIQGKLK